MTQSIKGHRPGLKSPTTNRHGPAPYSFAENHAPLSLEIADFLMRTEAERLCLFRRHLQLTLRRVSPLLIDLFELEGSSLAHAPDFIRPPRNWPARPVDGFRPTIHRTLVQRRFWLRTISTRDAWYFKQAFSEPGVVIRGVAHPDGRFAIRPCGGVLGFTAAIGPCVLSAFGSAAMLKLPDPLPSTLMASMVGSNLNEIVEHPIFSHRNYVIRRAAVDPTIGEPVISFSARTLPLKGPWGPLTHELR